MIEDHAMFLQDFSVSAQGGAVTLNGTAIDGIFDNANATALNMLGGSNPIFECPEASLLGVDPRGGTMVINGITYIVRENKPDGNGMTILELDKQ
jgi:hypothetical protein